jgi:hypothetical protein
MYCEKKVDLKIKSTREDITDLALTELKFTHFSHFLNSFLPARFEIKLRLKNDLKIKSEGLKD